MAAFADFEEELREAQARLTYELLHPGRFVREETPNPEINVLAVSVGERFIGSRPTDELCLKVYVRKKFNADDVPSHFRIPPDFGGFAVDIEESGLIKFTSSDMPNPGILCDPVQPGSSVSACDCTKSLTGTIGALVSHGYQRYVISNYHVLKSWCDHDGIFQPGSVDQPPQRRIGHYVDGVAPRLSQANDVDVAYAELEVEADPEIIFIGGPNEITSATRNMWVVKMGRSTRFSVGYVADVSANAKVYAENLDAWLLYLNQLQIKPRDQGPFSEDGDSGALVLEQQTKKAVGMLFAGGVDFSLANPIVRVLDHVRMPMIYSA